ncbi:hypothetical protein BDQ17DRAFT_1313507 [Cyathus striatus]|nr:hypothetical protein BDQ17DRAFT_1313507 [Cyathus striatus]
MSSVLLFIILLQFIRTVYASDIVALSANCSAETTSCGPGTLCCPSGYTCTARRGIPICTNLQAPTPLVGYNHQACLDPYFFPCDITLDISGFCCPIGSLCYSNNDNVVRCIDAYGSTSAAIPSSTMISSPAKTPSPEDDNGITFSPEGAWGVSDNKSNCGISKTIHTTSAINASITFNYTGPSVTVHTITSPYGGVFSVFVDGFDTQTTIDTSAYYSNFGEPPTPQCLPIQFPPFVVSPPDFQSNPPSGHSITLVFVAPSPEALNGTNASASIQFDAFSIPEQDALQATSASSAHVNYEQGSLTLLYALLGYCIMISLMLDSVF